MKTKILLLLLFVSSITFAQTPTDQVAKYTFNGGTLVNEVNAGIGDLTGTPPSLIADRFGIANSALNTNSISRTGYTFTAATNELSISFWLKGTAPTSGGLRRILQIFDSSGEGVYLSNDTSSNLYVNFKNGGSDNYILQSGLNIFNNAWHHIVLTIKQTSSGYNNKIYIDGIVNTAISSAISDNDNSTFLSSNANFIIVPTANFEGVLDDIDLFNRELTGIEAAYLYNQTSTALFVNKNATGSNDGSSWANAYTNLQDALDNSISNGEIWVASGTYYPTGYAVTSQQTSRDKTFLIAKPLSIFGGFNGTETLLSERDFTTNQTILSGDLNNDDSSIITTTETSRQDNVYHLVSFKGDYASAGQLDGFTISGANANSTAYDLNCTTAQPQQYDKRRGGAIYVNADSAGRSIFTKINNCIIENNSAIGMAVSYSMNPCGANTTTTDIDFENTVIRNNYSVDYANIYYGASAYSIERFGSLVNCLVYNNTSVNSTSVITLSAHASHLNNLDVDIINSTFTKNTSNNAVISFNNAEANSVLYNTIIYGNTGSFISVANGSNPASGNNIIEGGYLGGTNQDPLFTDAANYYFTLQSTSPAINSGDNTKTPTGITTDLLGNQRIFNTTVDMGCYEYDSVAFTSYTLTTSTVGNGSVTPNGTTTHNENTVITVTATADAGWQFDGWSGDLTGTTNPVQLTMDANKSVTATFTAQCTSVNIPDVNFKTALLNMSYINTNGDTEISCAEAIAFNGTIDVSNQTISDLTGIEAFVNITELNCNTNQLTSLNVSQNTALTYLNCYSNQLSVLNTTNNTLLNYLSCSVNQLTNLNITQNTVLEILGCGNNQLSNLDITYNTALIELHFYQNNISSMDVSSLSNLTTLNAIYNTLTYLNVANGNNLNFTQFNAANNPNLTCIQVDDVNYSDTNWTDIDSQTSFNTNCNLSVEDYDLVNFTIYPNPVNNTLIIQTRNSFETATIYTLQGQKVLETNQDHIDVSNFANGIYLIRIQTKTGAILTKQFIKR